MDRFLRGVKELSLRQRALLVDQAIVLLESFYVNLPLKCAMYAVDPLRRLKLLRQRLPTNFNSDRLFHREMIDIFNSLSDLHANYLLPSPFDDATAWLPFTVESYVDHGRFTYLATKISRKFISSNTFREGVEIQTWNGVPIGRAVEMAGAQSPSGAGNVAARHALGLFSLTARPLQVLPPPDEEWVIVGYCARRGGPKHEIRVPWRVSVGETPEQGSPRGFSIMTAGVQRIRKLLFASDRDGNFQAGEVATRHGTFGYLRIFTFDVVTDPTPDEYLDELIAAIAQLPRNGLIVDIRQNPGGRARVAEQLLQVVSPDFPKHRIEPERLNFINTPLTLELCRLQKSNLDMGPLGCSPWIKSMQHAMETGASFSASFPYTDPDLCNVEGRLHYPGPVILVTDGLTRSAAEILAAGFQDHGGMILGVDKTTGGAGGNARKQSDLLGYFKKAAASPFEKLPRRADIQIPFRRYQRVGPQVGNEIEDFGVKRNFAHQMTRDDLLNENVDLINHAASLLASKRFRRHKVP